MQVELNYELSAGKNAENKYKKRTRYLEKIKGIDKAMQITKAKAENLKKELEAKPGLSIKRKQTRNKDWYEKFRWFFTTNDFLVIAGKDAKSNEVVVKRHFSENDLYFHCDIHGAPHTLLKNPENLELQNEDKLQAASFSAIYSSAWKNQLFSVEVYSVPYGSVSKTADSGQSLSKGAFVIRGKRDYYRKVELRLAIFFDREKGRLAVTPVTATDIRKDAYTVIPGDRRKSDVCKELKERFMKKGVDVSVDELMALLPSGNCSILY